MELSLSSRETLLVYEPRNGARKSLLAITINDSLEDFVLPVPETLAPAVLEILVPKGNTLLSGDTAGVPVSYTLWLLPGHCRVLITRGQR